MSQPLSVALGSARTYLNDQAATLWTDAQLIPFAQEAHRELQVNLFLNGSSVVKKETSHLSIPANQTNVPTSLIGLGLLPADLIEPINVKFKDTGQPDWFYVSAAQTSFLPDIQPTSTINYWVWDGEDILLMQCTAAQDMELQYMKGLPLPAAAGDPIGFILGESFLGPMTAALAGASLKNTDLFQLAGGRANANLDKVIRANIRGQQSIPVRKRPYEWRFKLPRRYIL